MTVRRMVFDVESVGLHGEAFAVGYTVLAGKQTVSEAWAYAPPTIAARGTKEGFTWVKDHCPWAEEGLNDALLSEHEFPKPARLRSPAQLADWFWRHWLNERNQGATLWADVPWPVEARFLIMAVENERPVSPGGSVFGKLEPTSREWEGPFPLLDVRSYVEAVLGDYYDEEARHKLNAGVGDGPVMVHHPLSDARISAQKLLRVEEILKRVLPK